MTEHMHQPDPEQQAAQKIVNAPQAGRENIRIPASILVGAILICASIFYNAGVIAKKLGDAGSGAQIQNVLPAPSPSPAAQGKPAAPAGPVQVADRADAPVLGSKNAKVTVVEFADFQCPFCKQFYQQTFDKIKTQYIDTGKIKYVFRHFPLSFHVNAQISGIAAECASRQGKFWEYHNMLYTQGQADGAGLDAASLKKYAQQLGLNMNSFNQCTADKSVAAIVQNDEAEGTKDGVSGTPSFFINGQILVGAQPFASFQQALDAALAK